MGKGQLAMIDIDLRGIANLEKALKEMPGLVKEELGKAVEELVLIVEVKAKELCPVDTGLLRSSITPVIASWAEAYVGTNTEYAPYVEFGTKHSPAQPFLEPAFLEGQKQASKVFGRAVSRVIARFRTAAA